MYRLLIILALILIPNFSSSQNIVIDKVYQDDTRLIETETMFFKTGFTDRNPIGISLITQLDTNNERIYFLHLKISSLKRYTIPQNGIILLKACNDSVIESKQGWESYKTEDIIGTYIPYAGRIHVAEGIYPMSLNDLKIMAGVGVKKIRIETEFENLDINYSDKKAQDFGSFLYTCLENSYRALKNKKNIRDGF